MRILIVEDELLLAVEIEQVIVEMGHEPVAIATDSAAALSHGEEAEIALVDLDLRDGPTGKETGRSLAGEFGVTVVYMTGNPSELRGGVAGTIGVVSKPVLESELKQAVKYAIARRRHRPAIAPPALKLFQPRSAAQASA